MGAWLLNATHIKAVPGRKSDVKDAETGQRGYIITGDTAYLGPYRQAHAQSRALLATLRAQTRDNAGQQRRLDTLDALVRGYLAGWIADPQHLKPGSKMPATGLTAEDLQALLAYLETLK